MSLPEGREGVKATLRLMRSLVRAGKKNIIVRQTALSLTRKLKQKDRFEEIKSIFLFVRDNIRYVRDIRGVETVHTAERILKNAQGDCDDKSILVAALLESIGHPTRFVAVGFNAKSFAHVFTEVKIGDRWLSLETTEPQNIGWRPRNITQTLIIYN